MTALALPVVAVLSLHATPWQASALMFAQFTGGPVLGSVSGLITDRYNRRTLGIIGNALAALISFALPLLIISGTLTYWLLLLLAVVLSTSLAFIGVVDGAYLPMVFDGTSSTLAKVNSKLFGGRAIATVLGQAIGGAVIGRLGTAATFLIDALSFVVGSLGYILTRPSVVVQQQNPIRLRGGPSLLFTNRNIGMLVASGCIVNVGGALIGSLYSIYAYRTLSLSPFSVGLTVAAGSIAAFTTSTLSPRLVSRFGACNVAKFGLLAAPLALWLIPLAALSPAPALVLGAYEAMFMAAMTLYGVSLAVLRQSHFSLGEQGRVGGAVTMLVQSAVLIGALLGSAVSLLMPITQAIVFGAVLAAVSLPIAMIGGTRD